MPKRALLEKRPWLLASLAAAILYYVLRDGTTPEAYLLVVKGGALALLGTYALLRHQGPDSFTLGAMLLLAAAGAVTVDLFFSTGVFILVLGLGVGISLFARHLRARPSASQKAAAVAMLLLTPATAWLLTDGLPLQSTAAGYALVLGGLAGSGWMSAFPRYRVGVGTVALVAAALLDFARLDALAGHPAPGLLVWPLYYFGHFLICTGVIGAHRRRAGS